MKARKPAATYLLPPYTGRQQMVHVQRGEVVSGLVTTRCGKRFEADAIRRITRPSADKVICSVCLLSEQSSPRAPVE